MIHSINNEDCGSFFAARSRRIRESFLFYFKKDVADLFSFGLTVYRDIPAYTLLHPITQGPTMTHRTLIASRNDTHLVKRHHIFYVVHSQNQYLEPITETAYSVSSNINAAILRFYNRSQSRGIETDIKLYDPNGNTVMAFVKALSNKILFSLKKTHELSTWHVGQILKGEMEFDSVALISRKDAKIQMILNQNRILSLKCLDENMSTYDIAAELLPFFRSFKYDVDLLLGTLTKINKELKEKGECKVIVYETEEGKSWRIFS
mgnify:CR=1 FL=1|tara:strand:+ start:2677 stop:3465 length:789 start_codon:yes stop_codon:yes gene_type:complete